jgi:hypothetical protein
MSAIKDKERKGEFSLLIIAHRGLWVERRDQNSFKSLQKALDRKFGIETDIRDAVGRLVVSHDMPGEDALCLEALLRTASEGGWSKPPLLLNVKADGLAIELSKMIRFYHLSERAFCFDMSTPQMFAYREVQIPFMTRYSEFEQDPPLLEDSAGVWIDSFGGNFLNPPDLIKWLAHGKLVCYVSPELHKRSPERLWELLQRTESLVTGYPGKIALCTDYPERAAEYFGVPEGA